MIVFSAHADTNFGFHELTRKDGGYLGLLDNFAGVYAMMRAYFSGKIQGDHVRIELTEHEEINFGGAFRVREQIDPKDVVVVVDVTGIIGAWDFTIEKCKDPLTRQFVEKSLEGFNYKLFEDSPDPITDEDEVDVYVEKCPRTFFLGVPCSGGDYNSGNVFCTERSIEEASKAITALCEAYRKFEKF